MSSVLRWLNVLATCLLGGVLGAVLAVQTWPRVRALAQGEAAQHQFWPQSELDRWKWPKTLQVWAHPDDPLRLVRIIKAGQEVVPGKYELPEISGDDFSTLGPLKDWLRDTTIVLENDSSRTVVAVGISVILPARETNVDCPLIVPVAVDPFCQANPGWCDNGCAVLIQGTFHWGLVPASVARGLRSRFKAEAKGLHGDRTLIEGKEPIELPPGAQIELSPSRRGNGRGATTEPRKSIANSVSGAVASVGIEEAKGEKPCAQRTNVNVGCGFEEVSKFNIAIDVVYFADGTIWGNFGYGYATPNPDGIFTRVNGDGSQRIAEPASEKGTWNM